jgi:hypothetical protein
LRNTLQAAGFKTMIKTRAGTEGVLCEIAIHASWLGNDLEFETILKLIMVLKLRFQWRKT